MPAPGLGIIGCGLVATAHARALVALGPATARGVAVADTNLAAADRVAAILGCRAESDYRRLLDNPAIEAVIVCLPHDLHAPVGLECIQAGKHVLMEKPLATSLDDAARMVDAADARPVVLQCGLVYRYQPAYQRMHQLLQAGQIGRLVLAVARHHQHIPLSSGHWAFQQQRMGGGAIISGGIHQLDLLRWMGGEVRTVSAWSLADPELMEGEVAAAINLEFQSGAVGSLTVNWNSLVRRQSLLLEGTAGGVEFDLSLTSWSADQPEPCPYELPQEDAYVNQLRHFLHCIANHQVPLTSGRDALRSLELALCAMQSAALGGTAIDVDLGNSQDRLDHDPSRD